MPQPPIPASGRAREAALRDRRRAEALRANLRRRKDQARAREDVEETATVASSDDVTRRADGEPNLP